MQGSHLFSTLVLFFFFNDTATTEIYTLSLHDALPIYAPRRQVSPASRARRRGSRVRGGHGRRGGSVSVRSEEHTSELQSHSDLVCRLLLEKKKKSSCRSVDSDLCRECGQPQDTRQI